MTEDVSRETPPVPDAARGVFSHRLDLAERYAGWLAGAGIVRGLIGPREVPRLWERHLLNCAVIADLMPNGATVCDVGSGAGLPGLVVAIRRPDLKVTLLEPLLRRATFLEEVVADLGLENVVVQRGRAEEAQGVATFDIVTARAVAPLDRLARWCVPLLGTGGVLLAMKGSSAQDEVVAAALALRKVRARVEGVEVLDGDGLLTAPVRVVRVVKESHG